MENVVDLRLVGAMACLAYLAIVFVGDAFNPFARSRRQLRRLRLAYARSLAIVLLMSPAATLWLPAQSLSDGILWSLAAAMVPLCLLSLGFGFVAFRRWRVRRRERLDPDFRLRDQPPALTLEHLQGLASGARTETAESAVEHVAPAVEQTQEEIDHVP